MWQHVGKCRSQNASEFCNQLRESRRNWTGSPAPPVLAHTVILGPLSMAPTRQPVLGSAAIETPIPQRVRVTESTCRQLSSFKGAFLVSIIHCPIPLILSSSIQIL